MIYVYLNLVYGNDATAAIDDATKPFKTMTALMDAVETYQETNQVPVHPIDQGAVNPNPT